jgi:hypothetical protein
MLLREIVHADNSFDLLERVELDWIMNFEVPAALGDTFRFADPADAEYRALLAGEPARDARPFDVRLSALAAIVRRLPEALRRQYKTSVARFCQSAAESSGTWLWFGTRVSAEEKALLEKIGTALELAEPAPAKAANE